MADNNTAITPAVSAGISEESNSADIVDEEDPCSENTECVEETVYPTLKAPPENE